MNLIKKIACTLALASSAIAAQAAPTLYDGSFLVGATGKVEATFLGHTAAYSNDLYFSTDSVNWSFIFNNHNDAVGKTVSLGNFSAGDELFFKIHVNNTGDNFFSGSSSNNADGLIHVVSETTGTNTYVGFEDLYGGGDRDYDDVRYSFNNIAIDPVPEPETYAMLGLGLGLVSLVARRRKKQ